MRLTKETIRTVLYVLTISMVGLWMHFDAQGNQPSVPAPAPAQFDRVPAAPLYPIHLVQR